jgi:hypothetical protein
VFFLQLTFYTISKQKEELCEASTLRVKGTRSERTPSIAEGAVEESGGAGVRGD